MLRSSEAPQALPSDPSPNTPTRCCEAARRGKPPPTKWEAPDFPAVGGSEETAALPTRPLTEHAHPMLRSSEARKTAAD